MAKKKLKGVLKLMVKPDDLNDYKWATSDEVQECIKIGYVRFSKVNLKQETESK